MRYRRFGRTNLQMPVLSCGGMRYQQSWGDKKWSEISKESQETVESCIARALELGINHIETARGYGSSEIQLGQILSRLDRDKIIVQTKVGPAPAEEFSKTFDLSMKNLQLDQVDLLGFHGLNTRGLLDAVLCKGGALEAGRRLQREGRVRFLGFSTHADCETIVSAIETGEFDYVNLHWYWINRDNWPAIEAAQRHDMGVFIISPNDKGGKLYAPPEKLSRLCEPCSPMMFNDLFCLRQPEVHTLSVGVSKPADFDEHMKAVGLMDEMEKIVPAIEAKLAVAMEEALGRDWCEAWQQGIPRWEEIPGSVNVREALRMWNFAKSLDMIAFAKMRYNLLGNGGHWFPGENITAFGEGDLNRVLTKSPFAQRIPAILQEAHEMLWDAPVKRISKSK